MNKNNKGQINTITPGIVALVVAVIILVIGIVMINNIVENPELSQQYSTTVANESGFLNSSGYNLTTAGSPGANNIVIVRVINGSSGTILTSPNYTLVTTDLNRRFLVINGSTNPQVYANANITYSYFYGDVSYVSGSQSLTGLATLGTFVPLIVLAFAAAIIIGLILTGFTFGGRTR